MAVELLPNAIENFIAESHGPVVMLNLLRFTAGGRESYETYLQEVQPSLAKVGAEILYAGLGGAPLIADSQQAWEAVVLVRYPNSAAFVSMASDPEYQRIAHLRSDSIRETVLQPTTPFAIRR